MMESGPDTVDLSICLGPGSLRLSPESRNTLVLSWLYGDGDELSSQDLLRGVIAHGIPLLQSLRPGLEFLELTETWDFRYKEFVPTLSAEVYRVVDIAMREAGSHRKVFNLDLLIGLAERGQEHLARAGITAAEIRQHRVEFAQFSQRD